MNTESTTGAVSDTGFPVLKALGTLVSRGSEGLNKPPPLIVFNKDGLVSVLKSLFQVGESAYKDVTGEFFAIHGEIPANRLPVIVRLKAIHFTANYSFVETPGLEFESHLDGLTSSLPQEFEDKNHQPVVEGEDDGMRLVKLPGQLFVPCATAEIVLEQGLRVPITEVISHTFAGPML